VQTVVVARTPEQRAAVRALSASLIVPEHAVDGRSLVALADVLVSAGGTMIREAAVLGTPVWSIFEGRRGAVDERLAAEGRIRFLTDPEQLVLEKASERSPAARRDPAELLRLALPWVVSGARH
jgi:predicted glycosyltransferase